LVGLIGGTLPLETKLLRDNVGETVKTPYGDAVLLEGEGLVFIQRHGAGNIPPHRINHRANVWALKEHTDTVIGVGSVGSLKRELKPPAIVIPDDYIHLNPPTFFDEEVRHVTPGFDEGLRKHILDSARWHKIRVIGKGVYVQTRGPRLETKAEVRMFSRCGDIVGMTLASEATLACELGLKYAAVCSVDNYAHGITKRKLDFEDVKRVSRENSAAVEKLLKNVIRDLR